MLYHCTTVFLTLALMACSQPRKGSQGASSSTKSSPSLGVAPQKLFDPATPLVIGQEVRVAGQIEFRDPDEDIGANSAYARLHVANGNLDILLDDRGLAMLKHMDGRLVAVTGVITGNASSDMTISTPSYGVNGTVSGVTRVPEIRVTAFEYASPPPPTANTFADNGDGTVVDKRTGLQWQQVGPDKPAIWTDAAEYAKNLTLAGHSDWRLPSQAELNDLWKIALRKKGVRSRLFSRVKAELYWTSDSAVPSSSDWHYVVNFNPMSSALDTGDKYDTRFVICVRRTQDK